MLTDPPPTEAPPFTHLVLSTRTHGPKWFQRINATAEYLTDPGFRHMLSDGGFWAPRDAVNPVVTEVIVNAFHDYDRERRTWQVMICGRAD